MISITSITPSKNARNISVNQDINVKVSADFELDPRNVSFKINEVEVAANAFSVYNDVQNTSELDVTLYTRRRIKYKTDRRYGQDGMRYGMRDTFPSMLQYGSRYVIEITIWGENSQGVTETITDRFVFTTEEGVFYNSRPVDYFYSDATQALANYFPEWSKTRFDKFSNMQQLLNPIGNQLEEIQDFVNHQGANNFIQSANLNQIPFLHKIELGKDFEIKSTLNEDGSLFYVQPDISGIQNITRYDLFTTAENNLDDTYYDKVPTRIDGERTYLESNIIHGPVAATEVKQSIEKELEKPGGFFVKASGLSSSIYKASQSNLLLVKCRIKGKTLFDKDQTEDIILLNEREIPSSKLWSYIESIEFFNLFGQTPIVEIKYFRAPMSLLQDKKAIVTFSDNVEPILWKLEKINERSVLQKHITIGNDGLELLRNSGLTQPLQEYELLDVDGSSCDLIDIAVDPFSKYIYAISNDYLYIYDKREPYPKRLKEIAGDNGLADLLIELDTDEMGLNEDGEKEILFKVVHKNPAKTVVRYRLRVKQPDGTDVFIMDNGVTTTDMSKATVMVKQNDILLEEKQYSFIANQIGDYIIELETVYRKGDSSRHKQLFRIKSKNAIVKYKLERILNEEEPISIAFDVDQQLKILTNMNSIYKIKLHRDGVVIDYENKILYFIEEYQSVDIE